MARAKINADGNSRYFTREQIMDKADEYIEYIKTQDDIAIPTDLGFHRFLGVHKVYRYELPESYKEALSYVDAVFEDFLIQHGFKGTFNIAFHKAFMQHKHGWAAKSEVEANVKTENVNRVLTDEPID